MENYEILFISCDILLSSALGARYAGLFISQSSEIQHKNISLFYSPMSDKLESWETYTVKQKINPLFYYVYNGIMRRIVFPDVYIFRLNQYKRKLRDILSVNNVKNIIIGVTPFSLLLLGRWIKTNYPSLQLIADMSDPFSFNMIYRNRPYRTRLAKYIENKAFPYFDHIIVLDEGIQIRYRQIYPEFSEKFQVIEQGVDKDFINKVKELSNTSKNHFTFLYAGIFYSRARNPINLYQAFELTECDCKLEIYGNFKRSNRPKPSPKIVYHKAINREKLSYITAQTNALILFDNEYGYQVPGKTLETLASGKPVLFIYNNENSPTIKYVKEAKGVVWVKNSVQEIKEGIIKIIKGEYDNPYFNYTPYTWDKMRIKLENILKK
ncbi:MAG: hypothetical protein PHG41_00170 [Actinomycetota bacterium]|nr:hypothetical protein [Actinomycetota bacterium]